MNCQWLISNITYIFSLAVIDIPDHHSIPVNEKCRRKKNINNNDALTDTKHSHVYLLCEQNAVVQKKII